MCGEEVRMDLDDVVDELYALPPAQFTSRRDALATAAKKDGGADLAQQVRALRRPTAAAAAVNQLARAASDELDDYLALGERLREAQAGLRGDALRSLGRERQDAAADLLERASTLGELSDSARQEVEETLRAAVADPAAAQAVASGRLTKALSYAGFGEVDITAATATPLTARSRPAAPQPTPEPATKPTPLPTTESAPQAAPVKEPPRADRVLTERREQARHDLDQAEADAQRASAAVRAAVTAERAANTAQLESEAEVERLRQQLAAARATAREAQQAAVAAKGERASAERAAAAADKALAQARHRHEA
jgi:hypothetical protein